jgi:hypothetical protein
MLRPYKFVVQAVVQETDADDVTGESTTEPVVLFGCAALEQWARDFPDKLTEAQGATD